MSNGKRKREESKIVSEVFGAERILQALVHDESSSVDDEEDEDETRERRDSPEIDNPADRALANTPNPYDYEPCTSNQANYLDAIVHSSEMRQREKMRRIEKVATLKAQGVRAFNKKEYEKAAILFSKAISMTKDCPIVYNNRAQCYMNLKLYEMALEDLKRALKISPNLFKSGLLTAKAHFLKGDAAKFREAIADVKANNPEQSSFTDEYVENLKKLAKASAAEQQVAVAADQQKAVTAEQQKVVTAEQQKAVAADQQKAVAAEQQEPAEQEFAKQQESAEQQESTEQQETAEQQKAAAAPEKT